MPMCKVWNDNVHVYEDKREGIKIGPKAFVEMDLEKAEQHLGKFSPVVLDVNNQPDPICYKMLRIERLNGQATQAPEIPQFVFHKTGQVFKTKEEYEAAVNQYVDDLADPAEKEKRLKGVKGKPGAATA